MTPSCWSRGTWAPGLPGDGTRVDTSLAVARRAPERERSAVTDPRGRGRGGRRPRAERAPVGRGRRARAGDGTRPPPSSAATTRDRKSTRLNSSHTVNSYAVFCLKKKKKQL